MVADGSMVLIPCIQYLRHASELSYQCVYFGCFTISKQYGSLHCPTKLYDTIQNDIVGFNIASHDARAGHSIVLWKVCEAIRDDILGLNSTSYDVIAHC